MNDLKRSDLALRYAVFQKFALEDQRKYYRSTIDKYETASSQVNRLRALIALFTGLFSAIAGLVSALYYTNNGSCVDVETTFCNGMASVVNFSIFLAIALPALGAFFNMLADLYQWDRLSAVYDTAADQLYSADALSPLPRQDDTRYLASYLAYTNGTLEVMRDETAQWGLSIHTPKSIEEFLDDAQKVVARNPNFSVDKPFSSVDGEDVPPPEPPPTE